MRHIIPYPFCSEYLGPELLGNTWDVASWLQVRRLHGGGASKRNCRITDMKNYLNKIKEMKDRSFEQTI